MRVPAETVQTGEIGVPVETVLAQGGGVPGKPVLTRRNGGRRECARRSRHQCKHTFYIFRLQGSQVQGTCQSVLLAAAPLETFESMGAGAMGPQDSGKGHGGSSPPNSLCNLQASCKDLEAAPARE